MHFYGRCHTGTGPSRRDRVTLPVFGVIFFVIAAIFLLPMTQSWLAPLFWFCAKTGFILFAFMWKIIQRRVK